MRQSLILRLVDITLLLLLSLMAIASIDPYRITLPYSEEIEREGVMPSPLSVAVTAEGLFRVYDDAGLLVTLTSEALASYAQATGQSIEVVADEQALALTLLELHRVLDAANIPTVFLVQRTSSQ